MHCNNRSKGGKETLYINAHGTGAQMNDSCETKAFKMALGEEEARRAHISSTKSMTGHSLGFGGHNACVAFRKI